MKVEIQQGKNTPPNTAKVIKVSKNAKMSEPTTGCTFSCLFYVVFLGCFFAQTGKILGFRSVFTKNKLKTLDFKKSKFYGQQTCGQKSSNKILMRV